MFRNLGGSLVLVGMVQGVVALVAAPLLLWLTGLMLRAAGLRAVTNDNVIDLLQHPIAILLLVVVIVLVIAGVVIQFAAFSIVAAQRQHGRRIGVRVIAARLGERLAFLARRPSTAILLPYLLLLVPLGHVGFGSILSSWLAVPQFVSGELLRAPGTAVAYVGLLIVIWYVNLRLLFALPLLATRSLTAPQALRASWRLTRWQEPRVLLLLGAVLMPAAIASFLALAFVLIPTVIADVVAPDAAHLVASVGFALAQTTIFFVVGVFLLLEVSVLVAAADAADPPADVGRGATAERETGGDPGAGRPRANRLVGGLVAGGTALAIVALSVQIYPVMADASDGSTLVLGHRGFSAEGVENTIPSMEAANRAAADLVEMDVLQTADLQWVVMHDADLSRLTGQSLAVADLTLEELTALTVRAEGHEAMIPSLEEYLRAANAIGQPLLIEIKVHGGESDDFVDGLLATIDRVDGADEHIYHTLVPSVVEAFKDRRPELTIGQIVALAYGGAIDSPADFFVYEQGAFSPALVEEIQDSGKAVFIWTVNDEAVMRDLFRHNVDGVITDRPDLARNALDSVADETGFTDKLIDAFDRLLVTD